ncbi:MAG: hypothetical protein AAFZ07_11010 [Actinomycetota bacterium]
MTSSEKLGAHVAQTFGFDGEIVRVELRDGAVLLAIQIDPTEHARRSKAGLGAITDRQVITSLWELPNGIELGYEDVPDWVKEATDRAPKGVLTRRQGILGRTVQPPLRVRGALAIGRSFDAVLRRVGQVSALAPTAVIMRRPVEEDEPGLLNARLYGVGVAQEEGGVARALLYPGPVAPTLGPYSWWVAEMAYEALDASVSGDSPKP